MRGIRSLVALVLVLTVGCGGKAAPPPAAPAVQPAPPAPAPPPAPAVAEIAPLPAIPDAPQPAPASLLASASIGDFTAWLDDVRAYADAVRPGVGVLVTPTLLVDQLASQGLDVRGADLTRPLRVLALDPAEHPMPLVVVVAVADEAALRAAADRLGFATIVHGGWAAIGSDDALRAAAPYALTSAVAAAVPREPTVSVAMSAVVARFRPMVDAWLEMALDAQRPPVAPEMRAMMRQYIDGLAQLERIDLSVVADRDRATLTMAFAARADGSVAQYVGQQRPAGFALVERLGSAPVVFGGRIDHAALYGALFDSWLKQTTATYGAQVATVAAALFSQWPTLMTGEHAMSVSKRPSGMHVAALWDSTAGATVTRLVLDYIAALAGTQPSPVTAKPHRGVRVSRVDLRAPTVATALGASSGDLGALYLAAPRALFALAFGGDGDVVMRGMIDAAAAPKGRKPTPTPGLVPVLAAARARGDSYVVAVDLPGLRAIDEPTFKVTPSREHAALTVGFGTGTIVVRTIVPAAQLAAVMQ